MSLSIMSEFCQKWVKSVIFVVFITLSFCSYTVDADIAIQNSSMASDAKDSPQRAYSVARLQSEVMTTTPVSSIANEKRVLTPLAPFKATYELSRRGKKYGEGTRTITRNEDDTYTFSYQTKARYFFLSDIRTETSKYTYSMLQEDWVLSPLQYHFTRTGTGSDKNYNVEVDYEREGIIGKNGFQPFPQDAIIQDLMTYQLQMRLDLRNTGQVGSYTVATKGGAWKVYDFRQHTNETIDTPLGTLDTIKISRTSDKKDRTTFIWLAPEFDYLLVALQQIEDGKENFMAKIQTLHIP
jgi:hypothetical protein